MPDSAPARHSSITLSHPDSEDEMEEDEMEEELDEAANGENREDESLTDDTDGASFSNDRRRTGGSSSSSGGSFEEMRSPSPDESLEQTSTVSEDVEELESSLDGSQSSSLKQRSLNVHKHSMHYGEI